MTWPLNINNFSILDKLKISSFILNPSNRWTQGEQVKRFEKKMAEYVGCRYAVYVSSGSTANTLLAEYQKTLAKGKKIVVLPSTTWQTSCSPWIKAGFEPKFIDVSLSDFSIDTAKLTEFTKKNKDRIACVFPTSLIGFTPNMSFYEKFAEDHDIAI